MKLSKNGIKVLTAQYRAVLKKCLLINMGLFVAFSANAKEFTDNEVWTTTKETSDNLIAQNVKNVTIENALVNGAGNKFEFINSGITVKNSDLETNFDPKVSNEKGNILIQNTTFSYSYKGDDCKYGYEYDDDEGKEIFGPGDMAISGWDVTLKDNKQIVLGEKVMKVIMPILVLIIILL